jgi:hypothetical protein
LVQCSVGKVKTTRFSIFFAQSKIRTRPLPLPLPNSLDCDAHHCFGRSLILRGKAPPDSPRHHLAQHLCYILTVLLGRTEDETGMVWYDLHHETEEKVGIILLQFFTVLQ